MLGRDEILKEQTNRRMQIARSFLSPDITNLQKGQELKEEIESVDSIIGKSESEERQNG